MEGAKDRTDDGVDLFELSNAAADNVSWDDAANELDHAVGYSADAVDGNHGVRVVAAVVVPLVLGMVANTAICSCQHVFHSWKRREDAHVAGINVPPVAASRMMSRAEQKPKRITATARTFLVGYLLTCSRTTPSVI